MLNPFSFHGSTTDEKTWPTVPAFYNNTTQAAKGSKQKTMLSNIPAKEAIRPDAFRMNGEGDNKVRREDELEREISTIAIPKGAKFHVQRSKDNPPVNKKSKPRSQKMG